MNIRGKIEIRMDALEAVLKAGRHLTNPDEVKKTISSITKFWSVLDDEDRDYVNAARFAFEEKRTWIT